MNHNRISQFERFASGYQQAHKLGGRGLNLRDWGRVLGWVCIGGSLIFWIPASWIMAAPAQLLGDGTARSLPLTSLPDMAIATAFGVFLAVGPSVVLSVFVPGTRSGRLLLKLRILTPGKIVAGGVGLFLLYLGFYVMYNWWASRTAGAVGLGLQWAILGVIFTMVAPALFFEPASRSEIREDLQAEHEAQVYETATKARINLMLKGQQEAEGLMAEGLHNLSPRQLQVVGGYIQAFARAVDERHQAWLAETGHDAQRAARYRALGADPRTTNLLAFIGELATVRGLDLDRSQQAIGQFIDAGLAAEPGHIPHLPEPVIVRGGQRVEVPAMPAEPAEEVQGEVEDDPLLAELEKMSPEDYHLLATAIGLMDLESWTRAELQARMQATNFQFGRSKATATIAHWRTLGFVANGLTANTYHFTIRLKQQA